MTRLRRTAPLVLLAPIALLPAGPATAQSGSALDDVVDQLDIGGGAIPGGWYATPFWQTLLLSSALSGGGRGGGGSW